MIPILILAGTLGALICFRWARTLALYLFGAAIIFWIAHPG